MCGSTGQLFAEERRSFQSGYGPRAIQFSPDASKLIVGYKDGTIRVIQNLREPLLRVV